MNFARSSLIPLYKNLEIVEKVGNIFSSRKCSVLCLKKTSFMIETEQKLTTFWAEIDYTFRATQQLISTKIYLG